MKFATPQINGKDVVTYIKGWWECHCASVIFQEFMIMHCFTENRPFDHIIGLEISFS